MWDFLFLFIVQNNNMKNTLIILVSFIFIAIGMAKPASAQHCDVQKGDSMWRIAERYKIPFYEILEMNKRHHRNPHIIHPDDKVHLPDGSTGTYTDEPSMEDNIQEGSEEIQVESAQAAEILKLVNQERQKAGVPALKLSDQLNDIATVKAKDMADKRYFSHDSPTYGSPFQMLQQFGVNYSYAGENIAAGQKTPEQVMTDWMNSSGHRANILNKNYTQLGVGFYNGGQYGTEWVQLFIKP